jgi:ribonucleoside-diphosphate reductase alpha chain
VNHGFASLELGASKGVSRNSRRIVSLYAFLRDEIGIPKDNDITPRNYEVTTIAPTDTISLVAETSSGIEPNFSWAYVRQDTVGTRTYVHTLAAEALGIKVDQTDEDSIKAAAEYVVEHQDDLPPEIHFSDADQFDRPRQGPCRRSKARRQLHLKNLQRRADDTVESVDELYHLARQLGCKAVSYYRDGSREGQVLNTMKSNAQSPTYKVENQPTPVGENEPGTWNQKLDTSRVERPRELQGSTWRIPFEIQNLYVTVNHDGERILRFSQPARSAPVWAYLPPRCFAADSMSTRSPAA